MFRFALSTKRHSINYDVIMKNALKRRFWKTKWNLFDSNGIGITMEVRTISPQNETLELRIRVSMDGTDFVGGDHDESGWHWNNIDSLSTTSLLDVSIKDEHYNVDVFKNGIKGSIRRCLDSLFNDAARQTYGYISAKEEDSAESEAIDEKNKQYLDDCGIVQEDIRDAYMSENSKYITENATYFISNYKNSERDRIKDFVIDGVVFE